jgi:hypothetical protein
MFLVAILMLIKIKSILLLIGLMELILKIIALARMEA